MAKFKRTPPNKQKPETCEVPDCEKEPTCVLGGYWFCAEHGNRDYEKSPTKLKGSVEECYEAFCEFHPDGKDLYPTYSDWLFSKDEKVVSFRQGWAAANKNQRTERS